MSTNSINSYSNKLRLSGLSSGMDTETMIKQLMGIERGSVEKLYQKKTLLEWKQADYRSMNLQLGTLRDEALKLTLQSTFQAKKVSSSDTSVITATATGDAPLNSSITLRNISQLASAAELNSTQTVSANAADKISLTTAISSQTAKFRSAPANLVSFTIDVVQSDNTVKSKTFSYDFTAGTGADKNKTLNDVLTDINNASLGVSVTYDSSLDKVKMVHKQTGDFTGNDITITDVTGTFLTDALQLNPGVASKTANGTKAMFDIKDNGVFVAQTSNSNEISYYGIKATLKTTTDAATAYTLSVQSDVDTAVTSIKNFVTKYNEVIGKINEKTHEAKYRDYQPLTSDQKSSMSDRDIELWEERAKSGLLNGDSTLSGGLAQFRKDLYNPVTQTSNSKYNSLASIGITTGDHSENGKLYLDESKLKQALEEDPNAVTQLFTNQSTTSFSANGLGNRLLSSVKAVISSVGTIAGSSLMTGKYDGSTLGKQLNSTAKLISSYEARLKDKEDRYYAKFSAMETALNKLNSQSSWLAQQFGG